MGVNHFLLPVSDEELASMLTVAEDIRALIEARHSDVISLSTDGVAIVSLTAESDTDPLAFIRSGAPPELSGWIGKYSEAHGKVIECEIDMGYGPASYYHNKFVLKVAAKLEPITPAIFERHCDIDWLEASHIYPGRWSQPGRKQQLLDSFKTYRNCILTTAKAGQNLLVWNA